MRPVVSVRCEGFLQPSLRTSPVSTGRSGCVRWLTSDDPTSLQTSLSFSPLRTGRVRCAPDANSESFSEKAFSLDETHRTLGGNYFRVRCLNSDASDLIPDASGLNALHEKISNFFPCFQVPTPKCHNTCGSVLAFSQIFLSRIQVSTLLDPNAYAQDMDLVALDSRDDRDFPS